MIDEWSKDYGFDVLHFKEAVKNLKQRITEEV